MAASLGASYVEFDVQLTKDNVPVVYHDFLVAETGVDIPMHELTLEQFLDLNNADKEHIQRGAGHSPHHVNGADTALQKYRGRSVDDSDVSTLRRAWDLHDNDPNGKSNNAHRSNNRMRLTKTFKKNNFKGNARGHSIASSFVTLKELFKKIPANVGFNIECKFPMLDEAEEEELGQIMMEMNHWVDTVLKVVFDNANGRDIIFSSFHPDICIMLSLKQPVIPILFLTEGGSEQMADL
ncbi:ANM_HP_G0277930.mRNA.1.CDS.1 [Saccharomyces cerevisiae]|nr:ANM_HP_G0101210.mRNA.1.CDS.1 [Saccharomyces cerevisiae]CAI4983303.1 ANM_HP_G0008730.mRNA.1.CDS.1 [Saccharomyces cerevisiae]CAI5033124.1 ANM_HP_G0191610.mRNA.1.CDS.1 [Saccharomyces cerevisiae]CAI5212738.1 ANM_HP_G0277930.mRNA.1.CDS.1 [Saccharomyces cerevisiae]CAI6410706.1 ANM_HP_G0101210.mRNA.1.CDS.1 [Saccharomyces cerevisiae]